MRSVGRRRTKSWIDRLGRLEPVRDQVGLLHRPRQIQRDDDVDPFDLEIVGRARALRARRRHDHAARRPPAAAPWADRAGGPRSRGAARPARSAREYRNDAAPRRPRVTSSIHSTSATAGGISARTHGCAKRSPRRCAAAARSPPPAARTPPRSRRRGCARAPPAALAVRHARASVARARRRHAATGAGRVAVTIRIALSSAPRASFAVGDTFANLTSRSADSQPWISASMKLARSRPAWPCSSATSSSVVISSESKP